MHSLQPPFNSVARLLRALAIRLNEIGYCQSLPRSQSWGSRVDLPVTAMEVGKVGMNPWDSGIPRFLSLAGDENCNCIFPLLGVCKHQGTL